METIGDRIKRLRLERGLTQEQVADAAGKYTTQINSWENGRGNPNRTSLRILADVLHVTADQLASGQGVTPAEPQEAGSERFAAVMRDAKQRVAEALDLNQANFSLAFQYSA